MTAHPPPSAEALRRAEIRRRRRDSVFWTAVHLLGSLNLAIVLILTIAGAVAFATIVESKFDTKVAAYYIYDNPWFACWLLVLALNLLCAALTRWPWQRKHLGFVVTHAGIILMLIGGVIGKWVGFEAFVTLDKTKPPESRLFTKKNMLSIDTADGLRGQMPLDVDLHPPTGQRPFTLPIENTNLRLVIDRVTDNLQPDDTLAASTDPAAPPGVTLHFLNAGMNQDVAANLMSSDEARTFDFFGMAKIEMVDALPEDQPIALPPAAADAAPSPRDDTPFRETQVVFARNPATPIIVTESDARSGYAAQLVADEATGSFQVVVTGPNGTSRTWTLEQLEKSWAGLAGDGDPIQFHVGKFWPDFAVKDGQPVSISNQPNNPVVLVQITGPSKLLPPAPPKAAPPLPKDLALRIAPAREPGRIVYELERAGKIEGRGVASPGDTIRLGWSKWVARVDAVLPHAELHREMKELTGPVPPMLADSLRPGIRAHLVSSDGTSGPAEWIPNGTFREIFNGHDFARIGWGQHIIPLAFSITLEDFQVPRDEGTDTPSNYISSLKFDDGNGRVVHDKAYMNSPAMFPGDTWRSLLGWNYKFSQANWNPQNLNETTLQVLYDPGWPFKWVGSLGICGGIILMFYFMPKRTPQERSGREEK